MRTGVIIGRFQVPFLHLGHIHLITTALRECEQVVILLGCQDIPDKKNMYNVEYRARQIMKIFPHVNIQTLYDMPTNEEWSLKINSILSTMENPVLYHSRDSFKDSYSGGYPLVEVDEVPCCSGTNLRKELSGEEFYVLLSDSDGTMRSIPEPWGAAVRSEEVAKEYEKSGTAGYPRSYCKVEVFDTVEQAINKIYKR